MTPTDLRAGDLVTLKGNRTDMFSVLYVQRDRARCRWLNPVAPGERYRPEYIPLTKIERVCGPP